MTPPPGFEPITRNGRVVLRARPSWQSYWSAGVLALGVFALWLVQREVFNGLAQAVGAPASLSAIGLFIGLAPIVFSVLYHRYTRSYEIEEGQMLRATAGFVSRAKRQFSLSDKIQSDMVQSIPARLLNYGTVVFWTGDDKSRLVWKNAPDPDRIIAYINDLKNPGRRSAMGGGAAPEGSGHAPASQLQPANAPPSLAEAKKSRYTHFGSNPTYKPRAEMVAKRFKTPRGYYLDNDDGTISHVESSLMWMRAPWGMVWNGAGFEGEPIKLNWAEACRLFGQGAAVGYNVGSSMAYMGLEKLAASAFENGYDKGRCTVHAAGYKDWRLPTAAELNKMTPHIRDYRRDSVEYEEIMSQLTDEDFSNWRYSGKANKAIRARLYPEFMQNPTHLWTATGLGGGLAWAYDGSFPPGDHKTRSEMGVIFVRRIKPGELGAPKTIDEEVTW